MRNVVLVAGHAGSGKSEFSRRLAETTGWAVLDKDTMTRPLVELLAQQLTGDPHDRQSQTYLEKIRPLEYRALLDTLWEVLDGGTPGAIVAAPFVKELLDPDWVASFTAECEGKGARLTVVWVHCNPGTLKQRVESRGAARDDWKLENWDDWSAGLAEPAAGVAGFRVDNSYGSTILLAAMAEALAQRLSILEGRLDHE